jgi:hypothetical protein
MHPLMTEAIVHQRQAERRRLAERHRMCRTGRVGPHASRTAHSPVRRVLRRGFPALATNRG